MSILDGIDAVLFDMDGVLTRTQDLHRLAWRRTFEQVLPLVDPKGPSYSDEEYFQLLDGRPRQDGLVALLAARSIESVPTGQEDDAPEVLSLHGICSLKDRWFQDAVVEQGVEVYAAALRFCQTLRGSGRRTGLVTSSRNSTLVLEAAGIKDLFDVMVDGRLVQQLGLAGKPAPDPFVHAALLLGVPVECCAVIEDSVGGVAAGIVGGFGLVLGVDVGAGREALLQAGAHLVVDDLSELEVGLNVDDHLDPLAWPVDPWCIEIRELPIDVGAHESVLALGNGYLGWRGGAEEHASTTTPGSYVNGFHETWSLEHAEDAVGFARTGQSLVAVPEAKTMTILVDDEPFDIATSDVLSVVHRLDMAEATMTREVQWRTKLGKQVELRFVRAVSWSCRYLGLANVEVISRSGPVEVRLISRLVNLEDERMSQMTTTVDTLLDPRRARSSSTRILRPVVQDVDGARGVLAFCTESSRMTVAAGVDHLVLGAELTRDVRTSPHMFEVSWSGTVNDRVEVATFYAVHTATYDSSTDVVERVRDTLQEALGLGMLECRVRHRAVVDDFWARSDVRIEHDARLQQAIRWSLFQVACASIRSVGLGVSAKGVSGSGYDGHYFWDTEIYVAPMLTYTRPEVARNLLEFRHSMLPAARTRAAEVSQAGALFPWRTINGQEASAYYAAGTAQYHIDADIAYAVEQYVRATGDLDFMLRHGVEILVETARMWADLGFWRHGDNGSFHIHGVTGPDEYTTVVNDNLYTNVMARFNLREAAKAVRWIGQERPETYALICSRLGLSIDEVEQWESAAEKMFVGFDLDLGIHPQDAGFLDREVWDVPSTPLNKRPLLLHYHPLVIYRFQVIKQADVVLALALLPDDFEPAAVRADFEYYDSITTGDSTLSGVAQAIVAARTGYSDLALAHFTDSVFIDLTNSHGNTDAGVHVAAAGGVWSTLVMGFAGMNDRGDCLSFDPRLPATWPSLSFTITWRSSRLQVEVRQKELRLVVLAGAAQCVDVRGVPVVVSPDESVTVALDDQGPVLEGSPVSPALSGVVRADGTKLIPSLPF